MKFGSLTEREEKPPVEPPFSPEAYKLRQAFADNIAAVLRVRAYSVEARRAAYETTITALLDELAPTPIPIAAPIAAAPRRLTRS